MNGKVLPKVDSMKYLRVYLDKNLPWRTHIISKRKHIGLIYRVLLVPGRFFKLTLKILLIIMNASRFIPNSEIRDELEASIVRKIAGHYS